MAQDGILPAVGSTKRHPFVRPATRWYSNDRQSSFKPVSKIEGLAATEPVIELAINGKASAYPLRILMRYEIVNDELGGVPISVIFCPLSNAAMVFDRRVGDKVLDFGTTGKLRNLDLVMWDRRTESWWQQSRSEAIVGSMTGAKLKALPARLDPGEHKNASPQVKFCRQTDDSPPWKPIAATFMAATTRRQVLIRIS